MVNLFAVTTRGLEPVSAAEMSCLAGLQVKGFSYRRVTAQTSGPLADLLTLRTVDDVFIDLATWPGIPSQRAGLNRLSELSRGLDLIPALELIRQFRPLGERPSFSVTANFVGRRNYSSDEIKAAVAGGLRLKYPWSYGAEDVSDLNLRVFIEHETAYVGMRLSQQALHSRPYKQANVSGSLKPSVAAAMLFLAGIAPGEGVLDPFCGAGTILIEAALLGACPIGGDSSPGALAAARANAQRAGVSLRLARWDAQQLPLPAGLLGCIVTNLPWGRQVVVDGALSGFYRAVCAELRRALAPGGKAVVLTSLPDLVQFEDLRREQAIEISLFGQTPSVLVFSGTRPA